MRSAPCAAVFDHAVELIDSRPGQITFRADGRGAQAAFQDEPGGHRFQRVPPNERKGRVQTSTVTVAVLPEPTEVQMRLDERDLEWSTCRGSGPGGQNRNKTESAVQLRHLPTNTLVRCETERSQHQNRQMALSVMKARLWEAARLKGTADRDADRRSQVGSGMRGDKRRTYRFQDDHVQDHVTGRSWTLKSFMRGDW